MVYLVKIIGIVGSPRKNGNTQGLVEVALESAKEAGTIVELIKLSDLEIEPCIACNICKDTGECAIYDDVRVVLEKMSEADGIILGSPVYFGSITSQLKMLMDRSRPLRTEFNLKNKIGGAISVGGSRNGGQETTINAIHSFFLIHEAIVVGDGASTAHYGGTGWGAAPGDAKSDPVGLETSRNLGRRVAEVALKLSD
ncbi:MAG TPA: flavodoxin family protein [Methanobacteriaceae archaeon]|nr:flavodoxin family protein [Methanobacteriaceae archaeon]